MERLRSAAALIDVKFVLMAVSRSFECFMELIRGSGPRWRLTRDHLTTGQFLRRNCLVRCGGTACSVRNRYLATVTERGLYFRLAMVCPSSDFRNPSLERAYAEPKVRGNGGIL